MRTELEDTLNLKSCAQRNAIGTTCSASTQLLGTDVAGPRAGQWWGQIGAYKDTHPTASTTSTHAICTCSGIVRGCILNFLQLSPL